MCPPLKHIIIYTRLQMRYSYIYSPLEYKIIHRPSICLYYLLTKLTVHASHDKVLSGAHRLTDHLLHKPCSDHHHLDHLLDHHLDHLQIIFSTTSLVHR